MIAAKRIVIIGNSGSGKSYLARALSKLHALPIIHLDELFWTPGGFNRKQPENEVQNEIETKRNCEKWIVEGVFGELAQLFLSFADALIYLDMDWTTCQQALQSRGSESSRQLNPDEAEKNYAKLLVWAEQYWTREDLRSRAGHRHLFTGFGGLKFKFADRVEVDAFLARQGLDASAG